MLNLNNFKLKTSIKIVAAFLILLQAVFLLQKAFAGSPSTLVVKPLEKSIGFNLTWSFNNSDPDATYFLLKSSVTTFLSCPLIVSTTVPNQLFSGANTTIYDMNVGDIVPGVKYSFKACLYGSNNLLSGMINSPNLLEETNVASAVFTSIITQPSSVNTTTTEATDIVDETTILATTTTDVVATTTTTTESDTTSVVDVATTTVDSEQIISETKIISLSNVGKDLYWQTNDYFSSGFYVLWSKSESPVYNPGAQGGTYLNDPLAKFYSIAPYDGAGIYYVRVCEALPTGGCGLYSNQLIVSLSSDEIVAEEKIIPVATTTLIVDATSSPIEDIKPVVPVVDLKKEPELKKTEIKIVEPEKKKVVAKIVAKPSVEKGNETKKPAPKTVEKPVQKIAPAIKADIPATITNTHSEIASSSQSSLITTDVFDELPKDCVNNNILDKDSCNNYFFNEATKETKCENDGDNCLAEAREKYLNGIVDTQIRLEAVERVTKDNANGVTNVGELKNALNDFSDVVSLLDGAIGVKVIKSAGEISYQNNEIIQTGSSILTIDSDGDGLTDDVEKMIGTDPASKDTDADSYSDYTEYASGYNPLGGGKLTPDNKLSPTEVAIINNEIFEQPKTKGAIHEDFSAESITNLKSATSSESVGYLLQGKATPNTVVTLYIYSDLPLLITVKTDDYGNWKYELKNSLSDGEHEVYVALNDATGKVVAKSNPLSFVVKEAQAASITDVALNNDAPTIESENNNIFVYYLLISGISVLTGVIIFINLVKRRRNLDV